MKRRSLSLGLAAVAAVLVAGPVGPRAAQADAALLQGYVYSTVSKTTADTFSTVGATTFTRTSTGRYTIFARNLGGAGNAQITMWDTGDRLPICTVSSVSRLGSGTRIEVRCNNPDTSRATDAVFSMLYNTSRSANPAIGYVALTTTSTGSSTPSNQYRTRGIGKARVTRTATGTYQITVPGESFDPNRGVVMVSATGSSVRYCSVLSWSAGFDADATFSIRCYRGNGTPANSTFSMFVTTEHMLGYAGGAGGSAWSSAGTRTGSSTPLTGDYTYNSSGATDSHVEPAFGQGVVTFPDVFPDPGIVVKLAVSYGQGRCAHLGLHGLDGDDVSLNVACQNAAGAPIDGSFDVMLFIQFLFV